MPNNRRDIERLLDPTARTVFFLGLVAVSVTYVLSQVYLRPLTFSAWLSYAMFLFLITALLVPAKARINLFLVSFPVALCLFLVNLWMGQPSFLSVNGPRILSQLPRTPEIDRRTPREYLVDRRAAGDELVGAICAASVQKVQPGDFVALSGPPHTRTLLGNELGFIATFVSDRYGFNNPDSVYDAPRTGRTVVLIGDSYTQGYSVQPGDDIAGQLRAKGLHTFNLGCGGNGTLAELATYVEYGRFLQPDTVVLIYYEGNDLGDLAREWDSMLRRYLDDAFSQRLLQREAERLSLLLSVAEGESATRRAGYIHWLFTLSRIRKRLRAVISPRSFDDEVARFRIVMDELRTRLQREAVELLVVYLPQGSFVAGGRADDCKVHAARCRNKIMSVLDELNIRVLDFEKELRMLDEPFSVFPYRRGNEVLGHLTPAGYQMVAAAIARELSAMEPVQLPAAVQAPNQSTADSTPD